MEESIGGLWVKQGKNGKSFMSGKIKLDGKETPIIIFKNDKGDNQNRPDYRIFVSKPMTGETPQKKQAEAFADDVPF